jgi:simple sugar transport system permease protein
MNQIAVGFVLTIFLAKLSSYLGQEYVRVPGPYLPSMKLPLVSDIPVLGEVLFGENIVVLAAIISVPIIWYFLYKTKYGLQLRAVGENPYSAEARGINVEKTKFLYTTIGGILIGFGGAAFSLHAKFGWSDGHTTNYGWIALAIVIFGGWNPVRCVSGVYMFGALQALAFKLQSVTLGLSQVLPLIPFPLMILTLVAIQIANQRDVKWMPRFIKVMILGNQPQSLGVTFNKDG